MLRSRNDDNLNRRLNLRTKVCGGVNVRLDTIITVDKYVALESTKMHRQE